jgi:hypothetical protein
MNTWLSIFRVDGLRLRFAGYWLELFRAAIPQNHRSFGEEPRNSCSVVTTVLFLFFISICCRGQSLFRKPELIVGGGATNLPDFAFSGSLILGGFLRLASGHLLEN